MAAKFRIFEFWKRFWNWIFQKCTFLGLSKYPWCRSLKIDILPSFCTKSNDEVLICSTCRRYMPRCFAPRRAEGPTATKDRRPVLSQSFYKRSLTIYSFVVLSCNSYFCSSLFVVDWENYPFHVGPEGPLELLGPPVKTPIHTLLHFIDYFLYYILPIYESDVDKNGGKISKIRVL